MSTQPFADPLAGKTVAQYTILAKLGGGGMGVVYQAKDAKLGRLVALKFLPPQWSHDESAKQRFIREAQAASATDHPNICTIHDIGSTDDGQLFIVMAYYEGQTLKQKLEAGAIGADEALLIATQIADGLAKAHAQGVVHRDIKPGNVMVTEDGIKILDFGLAKFADSLQLTIAGSTLGTVKYMSPEQARGEEADARSDLWAVGVVLYEMLTGEVPFKGSYPEAISHAIRTEPPAPLKAEERGIPARVEQLVLKALQKDPGERFQNARELARDLRLAQGMTVPYDLRTEPVSMPDAVQAPAATRSGWRRMVLTGAAALVLATTGTSVWLFRPVPRLMVAVAPVANLTGYPELNDYRLALTQTLSAELGESPIIRVVPYQRLLEIVRQFLVSDTDFSSRETIHAITVHSGAQVVVVPTLVYENRAWRARAEFRSPETATNTAVYETDPVVSSLSKDTAYGLMPLLAEGIQQHFKSTAPQKLLLANQIRSLTGRRSPSTTARLRTLDAAADFERGVRAYEELGYANAQRSFASAVEKDSQNPLALAFLSHIAQILQQGNAAQQAADQASRQITPQTPVMDALFVAAVSAESRRDGETAAIRYRELAANRPDEPTWLLELGAFQYRRASWTEAVTTYRQALGLDGRLARPHLELCRLYNRLNESASAKEEGERALSAYRALGNRGGEGQALMCLTDMLRLGSDRQRIEARRNAEAAVKIFQDLRDAYNLARAQYYVALAVEGQGQPVEVVRTYEAALMTAREAGNVVLEPLLLMNLGAMHRRLGNDSRALNYYQQSKSTFERVGDEQRAAQNQANVAAILIELAGKPAEGLRDLQNALAVFQRLNDKNWELFSAKVTAVSHRYAGRYAESERELNRAIALASGWDMNREIPALTLDIALSRMEISDYASARDALVRALGDGSGRDSAHARIELGVTDIRLGQLESARAELDQASRGIQKRGETELLPELHAALGELALESGRTDDARTHFALAAALWSDDLPNPASVEARAQLGLIDVLGGKDSGRTAVITSLNQARKIGLRSLEARCRIYLARVNVLGRRFDEAADLTTIADADRSLGPELRAQLHYWHSQALNARGDQIGAQSERAVARQLIEGVRASLPEQYRDGFASRSDIRAITRSGNGGL